VTFAGSGSNLSGLKGAFARANLAKQNLDMTRSTPGSHNTKGGKLSIFTSIGDGLSYSAVSSPSDYSAAVAGAPAAFRAAVQEINGMKQGVGVDTEMVRQGVRSASPPPAPPLALDRTTRAQSLLASVVL
jgi:hypothetical protein